MTAARACGEARLGTPTINELFRRFRHRLRTVSADEDRVVAALAACRTARMGGSVRYCSDCRRRHYAYHSCRNRHCPLCQYAARERWVEARMTELLPVSYFHVVFTLPEDLRDLALRNKRVVYGLLMRIAWETLRDVGERKLAARFGAIAILHTWGQALWHHPHGHFAELLARCARKSWVVYTKRPFASPRAVLRYVGNYTHRVAISNSRIVRADKETVTFRWRDYADGGRQKEMTLRVEDFLRRFLFHVLPRGFVKIRFFGWMAHPVKEKNLRMIRERLDAREPRPTTPKESFEPVCPHCGSTRIAIVRMLPPIRAVRPRSVRIDDTS